MDTLQTLKNIEELQGVPDDQLQWLIDHGKCIQIPSGDHIFKPGSLIDHLLIVLEGEFIIKVEQAGQFRIVGKISKYGLSGSLPYSRASTAFGYGEAKKDSLVLSLDKSLFRKMITECHELTTALVHTMSTRIREFTKSEQQNDKMMALGKLSAGLAHELNNPSAAIVRCAQELSKHLKVLPDKFKKVIKIRASDSEVDLINGLLFAKVEAGFKTFALMERSEKEDSLMDWLDGHNIIDGYDIASNFVEFDIDTEDLDLIANTLKLEDLEPVLGWLNQVIITEKMVMEIEEASVRINDLVSSIKKYTHMDQAPEKIATDIHEGIDNTLTMLNHKIKRSGIEVVRNYYENPILPEILRSEMNQVWTNLIDNAIDAMDQSDRRVLELETRTDEKYVEVRVTDSGSGIPEDLKGKIFDPFFTTKAIGEGTGLGLDVVHQIISKQHQGNISVESKPGKTTFTVFIPIKGS